MNNHDDIRIYVACLASYNAGKYHGVWLDATLDTEILEDEIQAMLKQSDQEVAEDWAIHDYEGFGDLKISEYESMEMISALAEFVEEHGDLGIAVIKHLDPAETDYDVEAAVTLLSDSYHGAFDSEDDFARELYQECYTIPEYLESYIDYEAIARDLMIDGFFSIENNGQYHIFDE